MESSARSQAYGDFETLEEENNHPINQKKCRGTILTLPSRNDWKFPLPLYQYQGFWNFSIYLEGVMLAQKQFDSQPTDIILYSHPKTGMTWLKALAFAIMARSDYDIDDSTSPLLTRSPHDCVTFMELDAAQGKNNRDPGIVLPTVPTFRYQIAWFPLLPISFEEAFDMFCEGVFVHGPYWEHVLEYWKASLECPERILFLKYEHMKNNTSFYVKRLAEFMGYPFTSEEEKQGVVDKIIALCSLENLSSSEVNKRGEQRPNSLFACKNELFFRKGKVGDWKSEMTPEMGARLDQIMEQKLSGSGLTFSLN
ncbi:hypothetical protein CRYUN_Cryun07bG0034400 [Craigia yunnanensis]